MPLTPEQHASIAASYDKAASDLSVAEERRAEFAKRADWFRQLARLETKRGAVRQTPDPSIPHTLPAPESERKSNPKYLLASLWLIGSVLYMAGTLLFTIAVNPAEEDAKTTTISKEVSAASNPQQTQLGSKQPVIADDLEPAATASPPALAPLPATALAMVDRPHAISPDEPAYESPALTVPPSLAKKEPGSPTAPSAPIKEAAAPQPGAALEVTETATIRSGPSTSATKIGTASPGAALQAKAREGDWVQFLDPASGNTGWIHASLVGPALGSAASPEAGAPGPAPKEPDAGKKQTAKKPSATAQAGNQRNARPNFPPPPQRRYADLPDDEEFFLQEPRPGILVRRRMMREGLMSPGFLPPR